LAESFALHFSGRAAARLDEPPLVWSAEFLTHSVQGLDILNTLCICSTQLTLWVIET